MNPPALLLVWYVEDFCYKVEMAEFQIKVLVNKLEFITFVWCCYIFAIPDSVAYTAWCTLDFFFQFIFFWLYTCLWKPMLFVSSTCEEESCFRKQAPNPTQPKRSMYPQPAAVSTHDPQDPTGTASVVTCRGPWPKSSTQGGNTYYPTTQNQHKVANILSPIFQTNTKLKSGEISTPLIQTKATQTMTNQIYITSTRLFWHRRSLNNSHHM